MPGYSGNGVDCTGDYILLMIFRFNRALMRSFRKYTKNRSNNFLKAIKLKISCKQTFYANSLIFAEKKIALTPDPSEKGVGGRALYISPQLGSGKRGGHGL